jgi:aromatic-amino-acid transaminase
MDFEGMPSALNNYAAGTVVVLHACCHNPTGVDLTVDQWKQIVEVVKARNLVPFLDTPTKASATISNPTLQ